MISPSFTAAIWRARAYRGITPTPCVDPARCCVQLPWRCASRTAGAYDPSGIVPHLRTAHDE